MRKLLGKCSQSYVSRQNQRILDISYVTVPPMLEILYAFSTPRATSRWVFVFLGLFNRSRVTAVGHTTLRVRLFRLFVTEGE